MAKRRTERYDTPGRLGHGMVRHTPIGMALTVLAQIAFAAPAAAESGSTGGAVGLHDKSISGATPADRPATVQPKPAATSSGGPCSKLAGTWSWYLGVSNVILQSDGTMQHPASGTGGRWTCSGNTGRLIWSNGGAGRTDHITVSQDGDSMLVVSPWGGGIKFTASRR